MGNVIDIDKIQIKKIFIESNMTLRQYPILDQKNGIFVHMNAKCQPSQRNFRLTLRSGSQKTVHVEYVGLVFNI